MIKSVKKTSAGECEAANKLETRNETSSKAEGGSVMVAVELARL